MVTPSEKGWAYYKQEVENPERVPEHSKIFLEPGSNSSSGVIMPLIVPVKKVTKY